MDTAIRPETSFPLPQADLDFARLPQKPDRPADRADRAPHRGGPLSRLPDRARPPRQARAVQELRRRRHRTRQTPGGRRFAMAALFQHQGRDRRRAVGAGRARPVRLLRQDRRPRAGVRQVRQGQHHGAADHHPPGGLPQRGGRQGCLGRPQAAARGGVQLPARIHAGLEGALSRPHRPLDARRADRGGDRQGLPRRHPRDRDRAARPVERALCRPARERVRPRRRHA